MNAPRGLARATAGGFVGWVSPAGSVRSSSPLSIFEGCQVAFRGWLADRPCLVARLGASRTAGYANLIALAYRKDPQSFVRQLDGEFAAVIIDAAASTVLLIHDAVGIRPLFYARHDGGLLFGTHLNDLLGFVPHGSLDDEYFADFLAFGQPVGERTPFPSIKRLLPGETIAWTPHRMTSQRVWSVAGLAAGESDAPDVTRREEGLSMALRDAVSGACEAHTRVWTELSGGLDSTTVAAFLCAVPGVERGALGVEYPLWEDANERVFMDVAADHLKIPLTTVDGCAHLPFADAPGDFIGEPSPLSYTTSISREIDRRLAEHAVPVMLTGMGGDEVFGAEVGAPFHLADSAFSGRPIDSVRSVSAWRATNRRSWLHACVRWLLAPAWRHVRGRQVWRMTAALPGWLDRGYVSAMHLGQRAQRSFAPRCQTPGRQFLADTLWLGAVTAGHRNQRGASFDLRHPLLTRRIVECMAAVPWDDKTLPGEDRVLQRRVLRGVVPERIRRRRTKGGGTWSLVEGIAKSRAWVVRLTERAHLVERGMVNAARWRLAVERAQLGHTQSDRHFMTGVSLETWFGQWAEIADGTMDPIQHLVASDGLR